MNAFDNLVSKLGLDNVIYLMDLPQATLENEFDNEDYLAMGLPKAIALDLIKEARQNVLVTSASSMHLYTYANQDDDVLIVISSGFELNSLK